MQLKWNRKGLRWVIRAMIVLVVARYRMISRDFLRLIVLFEVV